MKLQDLDNPEGMKSFVKDFTEYLISQKPDLEKEIRETMKYAEKECDAIFDATTNKPPFYL